MSLEIPATDNSVTENESVPDVESDTSPENPFRHYNEQERQHLVYLIAVARHFLNEATQIAIADQMASAPRRRWFTRAIDTKTFQDYKNDVATLVEGLPRQLIDTDRAITLEDIDALVRAYPQMRILGDFIIFTKGAPPVDWRFGNSHRKTMQTLKRYYRLTISSII